MRYAAIILGIIAATLLLPQNAFARGGKEGSKDHRTEAKHEASPAVLEKRLPPPVVVEQPRRVPVVVLPPVVVAKNPPRTVVVLESDVSRHRPEPVLADRARRRPPHREHRDAFDRGRHTRCEWIEGHYESRAREVVVPGYFRKVFVAARYAEHQGPRGIRVIILVHPAGWINVWVPPSTEIRHEQVWVEGHCSCGH
jgi:hypothetical protein